MNHEGDSYNPEEKRSDNKVLEFVRSRFADRIPHRWDVQNPVLLVHGEQTSATLPSERAEMVWSSVETPVGTVSGRTSDGGPNSKYHGNNEDTIFLQADGGRLRIGVIDGAGGSANGRDASSLASAIFMEAGRRAPGALVEDAREATRVIQEQSPNSYAAGVLLELEVDGRVDLLAVGDSKALTIRKGQILPEGTTRLQNRVQDMIDHEILKPWKYYTHPDNNIITGAFGRSKESKLETVSFQAKDGDQIIMASDGVWDVVTEYEICWFARRFHGQELQDKIFQLAYARNNTDKPFKIRFDEQIEIDMFPLNGGDNISVVVVEKEDRPPALAIGDYVVIELPDDTRDFNWCLSGSIDKDQMVPAEKIFNGQKIKARVPIEQLQKLNPSGSHKDVTFNGVATVVDLFATLDIAGSVRGSQKSYSAQELKVLFKKIAQLQTEGKTIEAQQRLDYVTSGQEGQNLREAFMRLLAS